MMFLVSEVHPFLDGNGRIARVMMNAELILAERVLKQRMIGSATVSIAFA